MWCCLRIPMFSHFSRTPTCDGQTKTDKHRQTQTHDDGIYRAKHSSRGKNWQNWNLHTSKIGHVLPICLINSRQRTDRIFEPHTKFGNIGKELCTKSLDNVIIETETGICTSLKSDFSFRFRPSLSTKSALLNFWVVLNFIPICWQTGDLVL